jgi:hypothetical protein
MLNLWNLARLKGEMLINCLAMADERCEEDMRVQKLRGRGRP